jgi:nicotinamide mononucleotide (NMN) deamidase PncC
MHLPEPTRLIAALAAADRRLVVISTGGGSLAIPHIVTTPGASRVILDAQVPYSCAAVDLLLGGPQEAYAAPKTARRLAAAAWERAIRLAGPDDPAAAGRAVGLAVTASLRTSRPKRGGHRVCVAVQTLDATSSLELVLEKDARSRADEELVAAALALDLLAEALGLPADCRGDVGGLVRPGERIARDDAAAPAAWRELLAGERQVAAAAGTGTPAAGCLVFPGSFDPLHEGHRLMARIAEEIAERPVEWELSITNVDKPMLDFQEIAARAGTPVDETRRVTAISLDLRWSGISLEVAPAGASSPLKSVSMTRVASANPKGSWRDEPLKIRSSLPVPRMCL